MAGGRKLGFDKQEALDAAMRVFWEKGYLGAALSDLTGAMGINKPSMYAAFGNKEALFLLATQRYLDSHKDTGDLLRRPDTPLRDRLRMYLTALVAGQCSDSSPRGCYISLCLSESASDHMPEQARCAVKAAGDANYLALANLLKEDAEAKQRGLDKDADAHALTLLTILHGTASMARIGKQLEDLEPVINGALAAIGLGPNPTSTH